MRFISFISNGCKSATKAVQGKVEKVREYRKARSKKLSKQQQFLKDIEELNRSLTMREQEEKKKAALARLETSATDAAIDPEEATSEYVPMDEKEKAGDNESNQPLEHKNFFFELLHFAKNRSWKKKVMTALIMGISFYVIIDLLFLGYIWDLITMLLAWIQLHPAGAVICFLGFFVIATLLFVPPTLMYFGAGYAFSNIAGLWAGLFTASVVCFIGSSIGAILAFLRSRYMMRDLVELFAKRFPIIKCMDEAMGRKGFHLMLLMRLCPIVPFNGLNHVGAITKITLEEYTFALIGIIPNIILWVLIGATADSVGNRDTDDKGEFILYIIMSAGGIVFAMIAVYLLFRYARDELHKEIKEQRAISWHQFAQNSNLVQNNSNPERNPGDDPVEQGFELTEHSSAGFMLAIGLDQQGAQSNVPEDGRDEDVLWVWT